jgi:PAS domain S-box-containing protein
LSTDRDPDDPPERPADGETDGFADRLLAAATDAVVAADRDRRVVFANPAAESVFGRPAEDLRGRGIGAVFPDPARSEVRDAVDRLFEGEGDDPAVRDLRVSGGDGDGDGRHLSVSLFAHGDGDGDRYVTAVVREVTDRVRHERRLEEQNEQLTRLASVLSHDLREPLNNANAKLTLARETGEEGYVDEVAAIHERMGDLIDDVLALTTEGMPVEDARAVALSDAVAAARTTVGDDGVTVEVTDAAVVADPDRLQTVFENLLTNAARHAGPDVRVRIGPLDGEGFFVADDGPGIPAEERDDVFEYGVTTSEEGTGLGLSIVRDVAAAHGWSVAVAESEEGGARFEFTGAEVVGRG